MSGLAAVAWDEALAQYDFGPGHPLAPVRVALTIELARQLGVLSGPSVSVVSPPPATDAELETAHDDDYVAAVRRAGRSLAPDLRFGLGTDDNPVFEGMHEASALVAGATLAAARAVWSGSAVHAVSIAGGLHHAMRRAASGFCVYNDLVVAIKWLLAAGAERVAYVDTDVHHGDGVQAAFYDDPRVLTISLHEHPATLFPGTGVPGQPARLRQPPAGPPGAPGAHRGCPAARPDHAARPGARTVRRPVAAHRGRRLRAGPGGAEDMDAPAGDRGGHAGRPARGDPGQVAGTRPLPDG